MTETTTTTPYHSADSARWSKTPLGRVLLRCILLGGCVGMTQDDDGVVLQYTGVKIVQNVGKDEIYVYCMPHTGFLYNSSNRNVLGRNNFFLNNNVVNELLTVTSMWRNHNKVPFQRIPRRRVCVSWCIARGRRNT